MMKIQNVTTHNFLSHLIKLTIKIKGIFDWIINQNLDSLKLNSLLRLVWVTFHAAKFALTSSRCDEEKTGEITDTDTNQKIRDTDQCFYHPSKADKVSMNEERLYLRSNTTETRKEWCVCKERTKGHEIRQVALSRLMPVHIFSCSCDGHTLSAVGGCVFVKGLCKQGYWAMTTLNEFEKPRESKQMSVKRVGLFQVLFSSLFRVFGLA